jgi:hypothetical protein
MATGNLSRFSEYSPKFGCFFDERDQGFTQESLPTEVKELRASIAIDSREVLESNKFKFELIHELAKQLIEKDAVKFNRMSYPSAMYGNTPLLTATLKYLEPKGRHNNFYMIPEDIFSYNNQKWTQEEIFEGLRNTFPERFI